jgi:hypothetical protein
MTLLTSLRAKLFPAAATEGTASATGASTPSRSDFAGMMRKADARTTDASAPSKSSASTVASEAKPTQDVAAALASRLGAIVAPAEELPVDTSGKPVAAKEAPVPDMTVALPVEAEEDVAQTNDEAEVATTDAAADDDAQAPVALAPTPPIQPAMMANIPQGIAQSPSLVEAAQGETANAAPVAAQAVTTAQTAEAKEPAKAGKFEPLSLLQMVRDHMTVRSPRAKENAANDTVAATASDDTGAPAAILSNLNQGGTAAPVAPQGTLAQTTTTMPTVDLSASLGAQVVDMGVSGQWIDGLARDIAGLSANGAQGRFQINADHLGPIQVDIRQGTDGAAVSLTVATEVAELALRQDSDRLKLDAGLSAVRISEVKIERAPHVAEAARSDSTGNQTSSQQQGQAAGWQGQGQGQGMGQSSAQSHMQGRGQSRENIASDLKGSGDGVVLNHEQAADMSGDLPRARFA